MCNKKENKQEEIKELEIKELEINKEEINQEEIKETKEEERKKKEEEKKRKEEERKKKEEEKKKRKEERKRQQRRILLYLKKILKNNTLYFVEKHYKNYENYFIISCIIKKKKKKNIKKKDKVENKQIIFCLKTILHPFKKKYLLKNIIIKKYFNKTLFSFFLKIKIFNILLKKQNIYKTLLKYFVLNNKFFSKIIYLNVKKQKIKNRKIKNRKINLKQTKRNKTISMLNKNINIFLFTKIKKYILSKKNTINKKIKIFIIQKLNIEKEKIQKKFKYFLKKIINKNINIIFIYNKLRVFLFNKIYSIIIFFKSILKRRRLWNKIKLSLLKYNHSYKEKKIKAIKKKWLKNRLYLYKKYKMFIMLFFNKIVLHKNINKYPQKIYQTFFLFFFKFHYHEKVLINIRKEKKQYSLLNWLLLKENIENKYSMLLYDKFFTNKNINFKFILKKRKSLKKLINIEKEKEEKEKKEKEKKEEINKEEINKEENTKKDLKKEDTNKKKNIKKKETNKKIEKEINIIKKRNSFNLSYLWLLKKNDKFLKKHNEKINIKTFRNTKNIPQKKIISYFQNCGEIIIKKTKSNYFVTIIDLWTRKTLYKISGGFSYKLGSKLNKKKAQHKKKKFKTVLVLKKKKKEYKKTSFFALEYIMHKIYVELILKNYKFFNIKANGWYTSKLYRDFYNVWYKYYRHLLHLNNIIIDPKLPHNGMRGKKLRRL